MSTSAALSASNGFNLARKFGASDVPFIIRIWCVFLGCLAPAILASRIASAPGGGKTAALNDIAAGAGPIFNILALIVVVLLFGLYVVLWRQDRK